MTLDEPRWAYLASRAEIIRWADRYDAAPNLPRLVRLLIDQSNDQVVELQMRADEGVRLRGYDGFSRSLRGTPFVPEGAAVWEMGTANDPATKANADYLKRTADPLDVDPEETTFVFVTPRSWPGKNAWASQKTAEGRWSSVVALDVDDIDLALERSPAAHIWFSEVAGLPALGALSLTSWWDRFSRLSSPPLTPKLVLAGRADQAAEMLRILAGEARVTSLNAESEDELLAFVASAVLSDADSDRVRSLASRCIIVKDPYSLQRLAVSSGTLVLALYHDSLRRDGRLVESHHVLMRTDEHDHMGMDLPPIDLVVASQVFQETGIPYRDADALARLIHRSLYAFQRSSPLTTGSIRSPAWAGQLESIVARRAWLLGKWNENRSGDTDALEMLVGVPYDTAREQLLQFARGADPMFSNVGSTWVLTSIADAWTYAHSQLDSLDLDTYEAVVQVVLGAIDPRLEMPVSERWMAGVYGKVRLHSADLRTGLAEMLAYVGSRAGDVSIGGGEIQTWLHAVLNRLFVHLSDDDSADRWASVSDVLPLLAEAGPDVFLGAMQLGVRGDDPLLAKLFTDNGAAQPMTVTSPHPSLLWALEGLAWSTEHFGLTVEVLAALTELDPGGQLGNRPAASLTAIFRPWIPQTSADSERRLTAIDRLRERHPGVSWKLLLSLLPSHFASASPTYKPRFRTWPIDQPVTLEELAAMNSAVAERTIEDAGVDPARWSDLVERLSDLPESAFEYAIERLRGAAGEPGGDAVAHVTWESLLSLLHRHQRFAHTDWAMTASRLAVLDSLQEEMAPVNPIERLRWVFDKEIPDIPEGGGGDYDHDRYASLLAERRRQAVRAVYESLGVGGVLGLAEAVNHAWQVGFAVGEEDLDGCAEALLEHLGTEGKLQDAARGFVSQRTQEEGWPWTAELFGSMDGKPQAQARLLLVSRDYEQAWATAHSTPEVDRFYWQEFSPYGLGVDFSLADEAARQLLAHGRPRTALVILTLYLRHGSVHADVVLDALEAFLDSPNQPNDGAHLDSFEIESILEFLRTSGADEERLAILEWRLLPSLRFDVESSILESRMAKDPAFFVEVLSLCMKPRHADVTSEVPELVASNAYQLLRGWAVLPGSSSRGARVDADTLNSWMDEAVRLLQEADREEVGLDMIGETLARSTFEDDGSWPEVAVRDLIERVGREELDLGFQIGVSNSRGVTTRGLTDGGEQERELSARYRSLSEKISDAWPRTARILRGIAERYSAEAEFQDEQVRRYLEGLER